VGEIRHIPNVAAISARCLGKLQGGWTWRIAFLNQLPWLILRARVSVHLFWPGCHWRQRWTHWVCTGVLATDLDDELLGWETAPGDESRIEGEHRQNALHSRGRSTGDVPMLSGMNCGKQDKALIRLAQKSEERWSLFTLCWKKWRSSLLSTFPFHSSFRPHSFFADMHMYMHMLMSMPMLMLMHMHMRMHMHIQTCFVS
jgi:hypothetical protein